MMFLLSYKTEWQHLPVLSEVCTAWQREDRLGSLSSMSYLWLSEFCCWKNCLNKVSRLPFRLWLVNTYWLRLNVNGATFERVYVSNSFSDSASYSELYHMFAYLISLRAVFEITLTSNISRMVNHSACCNSDSQHLQWRLLFCCFFDEIRGW